MNTSLRTTGYWFTVNAYGMMERELMAVDVELEQYEIDFLVKYALDTSMLEAHPMLHCYKAHKTPSRVTVSKFDHYSGEGYCDRSYAVEYEVLLEIVTTTQFALTDADKAYGLVLAELRKSFGKNHVRKLKQETREIPRAYDSPNPSKNDFVFTKEIKWKTL
jgi:hypothetical protein